MQNPVRKYSADIDSYYEFTSMMTSVLQSLGEDYAIHKQDVFIKRHFDMSSIARKRKGGDKTFLSDAYFRFSMAVPTRMPSPTLSSRRRARRAA